jgi:hypothetical protein
VVRPGPEDNRIRKNFYGFMNWDGELLATYILNKPLLSFSVFEEDNCIYATTLDEIDKIYKYKIPGRPE